MKVNKKILVLSAACLFVFCSSLGSAYAATINAKSCSYTDVSKAVSSAGPGDTVLVPAGTSTWKSTLYLNKSIRLAGAGMASTKIVNGGVQYLIHVEPANPASEPYIEITGFTFDGNNGQGTGGLYIKNANNSYIFWHNFRIHNNTFQNCYYAADHRQSGECLYTRGFTYGLIDNNTFKGNEYGVNIRGYDWHTWDQYQKAADNTLVYNSLGMGGPDFVFVENNYFVNNHIFVVVSGEGARWVARYNTIDGTTLQGMFDIHGDTRNDGNVAVEIYENHETSVGDKGGLTMVDYRGGTAMIYNNTDQVEASGYRTSIKVREETSPCGALRKGYDMRVHNGYIWNNKNTVPDPNDPVYIDHRVPRDFDQGGCLQEKVDYWADTHDGSHKPTGYFNHGTSLPKTCNIGDAYAVENTSGIVTALYRCLAGKTWTLVYRPYAYPHPLSKTTQAQDPPMAPSHLRVVN